MRRIRYKKIFKDGIIGYVQRIALTVFTTLLVAFVLSLFLEFSFKELLKFSTLVVLIIGAMSVFGGTRTTYDSNYNYHKSQTGLTHTTKNDIELLKGSYGFCIFMGISALILFLIYLLI